MEPTVLYFTREISRQTISNRLCSQSEIEETFVKLEAPVLELQIERSVKTSVFHRRFIIVSLSITNYAIRGDYILQAETYTDLSISKSRLIYTAESIRCDIAR